MAADNRRRRRSSHKMGQHPFSLGFRLRVSDRVLELAKLDERVVAGAVVGSAALGEGDRWSDLDLTFAVADEVPVDQVLRDWTGHLEEDFRALRLFDLMSGASIYRVFLLPGCLQLDLSLTPAASFGAVTPKFRVLFGDAADKPHIPPRDPHELFGYAVHHALRARFCIERRRYWQAEYWISGVRDCALSLACQARRLPTDHGRGFDDLPDDVRTGFTDALVSSMTPSELLRALDCAISGLLRETSEIPEMAARAEPELRLLVAQWDASPEVRQRRTLR